MNELKEKVEKALAAIREVEKELDTRGQPNLRWRVYGIRVDLAALLWRCRETSKDSTG